MLKVELQCDPDTDPEVGYYLCGYKPVMHAAAERRRRRFFCHAADAEKNARRDSA